MIKLLAFLILFPAIVAAQVGEANFSFAYQNIGPFIELCLNDKKCDLNEQQKTLLMKIHKAIPEEKKNPNQLIFASEKENPGLFILNGNPKIAKTYDEVGSSVFVNKDMLDHAGSPISTLDALAILIHELGHHHQEMNEDFLDLLGLKVVFYYQQIYFQASFNDAVPELRVSAYNYWSKISVNSVFRSNAHFDLIISDTKVSENLSLSFKDFDCSYSIPAATHCDDKPVMMASNVQNLAWYSANALRGQVVYICRCFDNSLKTLFSAKKNFELNVELLNKQYKAQSATIGIMK